MKDALTKTDRTSLESKDEVQLREILKREFDVVRGTSRLTKKELVDLIMEKQQDAPPPQLIHLDEDKLEVKVTSTSDGKATTVNVDGHISIVDEDTLHKMIYLNFHDIPTKTKQGIPFTFGSAKEVDSAYDEIKTLLANRYGFMTAKEVEGTTSEDKILEVTSAEFTRIYGHTSFVSAKSSFLVTDVPSSTDSSTDVIESTETKAKPKVAKQKMQTKAEKTGSKSDKVRSIIAKFKKDSKIFSSGDVMKAFTAETGQEIHRSFVSTLIGKANKAGDQITSTPVIETTATEPETTQATETQTVPSEQTDE